MRLVFALALLAGSVALARSAQPDPDAQKPPDPRFGVQPKLKIYPQTTAKKALASAIEAIEKPETAYLLAHLLDPGFVEFRLADRAKTFDAANEVSLTQLRDIQIKNPDRFKPEDRVPADRAQFKALIVSRSREQAFKQLVRDVEEKFLDDPQALKDMKKLWRDGAFVDTETGAKVSHPDIKDRALYFRKIGDRWFLENRLEDAPPAKEPPPKKDPGL